jgi:hypothetical protein
MNKMKLAVGVLPLVALLGCSAKALDLGGEYQDGGSGSDGGGSGSGSDGRPSALSGVYSGYIESFMFPDGSDEVKMTLSFNADGTVTGTVFFGNGPALAPPTDPNVGYPPGVQGGLGPATYSPTDFAYTILNGTYMAPRLQLQIETQEIFKAWCQLQTQIYEVCNCGSSGCGDFSCLPNSATMTGGSSCAIEPCGQTQFMAVDCGKLSLCSPGGPCKCTAAGCTVQVGPMGDVAFDTQVTPAAINGSVTGLTEMGVAANLFNVHLTEQP